MVLVFDKNNTKAVSVYVCVFLNWCVYLEILYLLCIQACLFEIERDDV